MSDAPLQGQESRAERQENTTMLDAWLSNANTTAWTNKGSEAEAKEIVMPDPFAAPKEPTAKELAQNALREQGEKSGIDKDVLKDGMSKFESRAAFAELSEEKIAKTYQNIADIISGKDTAKPVLDSKSRVKLAESIMHQLAEPQQAGILAAQMLLKRPDEYTRMLKELALRGTYTSPTGQVLKLPK